MRSRIRASSVFLALALSAGYQQSAIAFKLDLNPAGSKALELMVFTGQTFDIDVTASEKGRFYSVDWRLQSSTANAFTITGMTSATVAGSIDGSKYLSDVETGSLGDNGLSASIRVPDWGTVEPAGASVLLATMTLTAPTSPGIYSLTTSQIRSLESPLAMGWAIGEAGLPLTVRVFQVTTPEPAAGLLLLSGLPLLRRRWVPA